MMLIPMYVHLSPFKGKEMSAQIQAPSPWHYFTLPLKKSDFFLNNTLSCGSRRSPTPELQWHLAKFPFFF